MVSSSKRSLFYQSLACIILLISLCQSLEAKANIEHYWLNLKGYNFEKITETTEPQQQNQIGPFSQSVLNEYILLSHSRWKIHSKNNPHQSSLELEVYEMKDSTGAFGIFSAWDVYSKSTSKGHLRLTVDNHKHTNSLCFWRGPYFFHLTNSSITNINWNDIKKFAASLIKIIPLANIHPVTVMHLPKEGLVKDSIRFYLGEASFASNSQFPKKLHSAIGFDEDVEITYAHYLPENYPLFIFGYPTPALAALRSASLQNSMQSYFSPHGIYMKRVGVLVALFFGTESKAKQVLEKVQYAPTIKWIYEKNTDPIPKTSREEILTFLGVFKRSILMTLFLISITIGTGIGLGFILYRIRSHRPPPTPKAGFHSNPKDTTIYLNLNSKTNVRNPK